MALAPETFHWRLEISELRKNGSIARARLEKGVGAQLNHGNICLGDAFIEATKVEEG